MGAKISQKESATILNSLFSGVVPRIGLLHIAVGRKNEVDTFLKDLETISDGGAACRFIAGAFGSGKSFLLQLVRNYAMEKNFVVIDADLTPERRLTGAKGQGLATYRELMQKISVKTRPDGSALEAVLQKWISTIQFSVAKDKGLKPGDPELVESVSIKIKEILNELSEMAYGFTFSNVIDAYWRSMKTGNSDLRQASLRWLRGEFLTKTDAKRELPVDSIISDGNWYDFLKLFAVFVHKAGYKGLVIFLDEGINLYKISNKLVRESNYEKLLSIFNDTMQGKASYIGFYMSGTLDFIYDERRGLFSYEALRSRLAEHRFNVEGYTDYSSPVIKLSTLTKEEIYLLLERLCVVHSSYNKYECKLGPNELTAFIKNVTQRIGADKMLTPREVTRDFLGLLNILHQNPGSNFEELLKMQKGDPTQAEDAKEKTSEEEKKLNDLFSDFEI